MLAELRTLRGTDFATRLAQSAYLEWVFRRVLAELPSSVTVEWHDATATAVTGPADGPQHVHLPDSTTQLTADLVVLAQGHLGSAPGPEHRDHAAFARPRTDAPAFRQNDAVARALLRALSATEDRHPVRHAAMGARTSERLSQRAQPVPAFSRHGPGACHDRRHGDTHRTSRSGRLPPGPD